MRFRNSSNYFGLESNHEGKSREIPLLARVWCRPDILDFYKGQRTAIPKSPDSRY
jgi:hypothetical protein